MSLTSQPRLKPGDAECPFRKLPNELVCIIFESTCPDNLLQEFPWPTESRPATELSSPVITYLPTLAISAVCTQWRSLALATPRLWSQFRLEITCHRGWSSDLRGGFISTFRLYLDRSADSPLRIDLETEGGSSVIQSHPTALKLLLDHCYRWKGFSYTGNHNVLRGFSPQLSFPILEDLSLGRYTLIQMPRPHCFSCAPNLRALKADFVYRETCIPWHQLTSLDIRLINFANIHLCYNLTTLILRSLYVSTSLTTVSLAKLKSLTLALFARDGGLLGKVLDACTFSSLGELTLAPSILDNLVWPVHAFDAFISRSSCILTSLSISGVEVSDLDLLAAFRILPFLVDFAFDDPSMPAEQEGSHPITSLLISRMVSSLASEILLPKLRTLSLTLFGTSFDDAALISMISSRWLPDPVCAAAIGIDCLRSLVLRFREREVDEEKYRPLYDLDRMGMRVVIIGKSMDVTKAY